MAEQYGFYTEEYDNEQTLETLMTGDGKSTFTDIIYEDGTVAVGIGYGDGKGLDTEQDYHRKLDDEMMIKWQVKFENQLSIDGMIKCLLRLKNKLNA